MPTTPPLVSRRERQAMRQPQLTLPGMRAIAMRMPPKLKPQCAALSKS
jgi:hypothetical protein